MSQLTKNIIFMIVFVVVCGLTTYLGIQYVNDKNDNNENTDIPNNTVHTEENKENTVNNVDTLPIDRYVSNLPDNSELLLQVGDKYYDNNITLEEKTYQYEKVKATYYQIVGLKDKEIQEKINKEIKDEIEKYIIEFKKNYKNFKVSMTINGNFANVLSLTIYDYENGYNSFVGLNYDLTTGNRIKFTDLFINNCEGIILNKLLDKVKEEWVLYAMLYEDESNKEQWLYDTVNEYKNNKENLQFYFSDEGINFCLGGYTSYIYMDEISQYISIFRKYVTQESIFENGNLEKATYFQIDNVSYKSEWTERVEDLEEYNENLWINKIISVYDKSLAITKYQDDINRKIEQLKNDSRKQEDIVKVFSVEFSASTMGYKIRGKKVISIELYQYEYSMNKEYFDSTFKYNMFNALKNERDNTALCIVDEEKVKSSINVKKVYAYMDNWGEVRELTLKDLFVDGYDYTSVFKQNIAKAINEIDNGDDEYYYYEDENYIKNRHQIMQNVYANLDKIDNVDITIQLGDIMFYYDIYDNSYHVLDMKIQNWYYDVCDGFDEQYLKI